MNQAYRDATSKMEEMKLNPDYIIGWQSGFLGHSVREEQRINDAYQAGRDDGEAGTTDNFGNWTQ